MFAFLFRAPVETAELSSNVCCRPSVLLRAHVVFNLLDRKARFEIPHAANQRGGPGAQSDAGTGAATPLGEVRRFD